MMGVLWRCVTCVCGDHMQLRGEALYRLEDYKMAMLHFREGIKWVTPASPCLSGTLTVLCDGVAWRCEQDGPRPRWLQGLAD